MILQHLYKIRSVSELESAGYEFLVEIDPGDPLFKGHFPERPILPGVCTIEITRACTCQVLGKQLHFTEIAQCKFMGMVDPFIDNKLIVWIYARKESEGRYIVNASIDNSGMVVFKIKATVTEVNHGR